MIYTTLGGRCGNQLFSYAISRKLQMQYDDEITFCDGFLVEKSKTDSSFENVLKLFKLSHYYTEHIEKPIEAYGNVLQKAVYYLYKMVCKMPYKSRPNFYRRQEKWQLILNRVGIYKLVRGYSPLKYTHMKNKFVEGSFEDERWFNDIKDSLLREIKTNDINKDNNELYRVITTKDSVCVSIRRGDFFDDKHKGTRAICNENYFLQAIAEMKKRKPEAVFIIFSDEVNWVRNNYDFGVETYYESGEDTVAEKLRLMSGCKNFILSNSTFSWWAQYLSDSKEKIVISPDRWFNMPGYTHSLISDDWILINCD